MSLAALEKDKEYGLIAAVKEVSSLTAGKRLTISGLYGSSKAFFIASVFKTLGRPVLAVVPSEEYAEGFAGDLMFFLGKDAVSLFPSPETLPFDLQTAHQEILASRVELLNKLLDTKPFITVVSAQNLMARVMPREALTERILSIKAGSEYPLDTLIDALPETGYTRMSMVEERGEFSLRGGILDIFPPVFDSPLRIEFNGDEVESIRAFDIVTQRSLKEVSEAIILPAGEMFIGSSARRDARTRLIERAEELGLPRESWEPLSNRLREGAVSASTPSLLPLFHPGLDTVFDYLKAETVISMVDPSSADAELERFENGVKAAAEKLVENKQFFVDPTLLYLDSGQVREALKKFAGLEIEPFKGGGVTLSSESNLDIKQDISTKRSDTSILQPLADRIEGFLDEGQHVYITAHNKGQAERTVELMEGYRFHPSTVNGAQILDRGLGTPGPSFAISVGSISAGFRLKAEALAVISEEEIFGERVKRRAPPAKKTDAFALQLQDLSEGDFIVHAHHGIGIYRGLKRLGIDNIESEFLLIEYRDNDKLYLPVWRMDLVSKYHGVEGRHPVVDKLGTQGWNKTKKRAKKAVERMAGELLKLYAERQVAEGFAFSRPDRIFHEFEAGFEYEETPDQARAIEDVLRDMEDGRPMDRLICGDVGYGKTEVAIRAAFKAALDNRQSAVLVPTTVLAQQHYLTFSKRLAPYPVTVAVLSRFKSKKEQRATVERLKKGEVDIIIGTHRLLQKDVEFKDLGLIVIDEEHRFGVKQKERLKQLRKSVDCLTLTATPIPRTLHMSLAGIRDLSIINTPPEDRLAIKTNVIRFDEGAIAEAVEREIKRGGQVFFVHNRIQSIGAMAEFLGRAVPGARVAVAHGRMNESELEKKMLGFVGKDYDVLLSTAIIESGLDIPSANTIIINRADRFGLAELYQLRGRVGRSRHRAYAYFICPDTYSLTEDAKKRIEVIQELCDPGSGFKVATYDLEIRGAGEFLGTSQSGAIAEVGYEMYTQLLEEAVRELKGEAVPEEPEPEINLKVSQYIPEEYIPDTGQRLGFYKRLASVPALEDLSYIAEEMTDRYGTIPASVNNLIQTMELKIVLKRLKAKEISQKGTRLYITFGDFKDKDAEHGGRLAGKVLSIIRKEPRRFKLTPDSRLIVFMPEGASALNESRYILKELLDECYS